MRVLITGGTGSLGHPLALRLAEADHEVIILSRDPERHRPRFPENIRLARWDGHTTEGWGSLVDGADAVLNLAGESLAGSGFLPARWTAARKQRFYNSRVNAGRAVVEAIQATGRKPAVLLQASAVGYYGPVAEGEVTEESPPGQDFLARLCVDWEATTEPVEALGVRRVLLRTGLVLDPKSGPLPRLALPTRLFGGAIFGSGKQWMPWIHKADELGAIQFLLEHAEASGPFNLTAPEPVRHADFMHTLGRVLRRPLWMRVPGFAMRLALGEVAEALLTGQRAVPRRLLELGFTFRFPELEPALRDLLT